jgi:antitoxin HicB
MRLEVIERKPLEYYLGLNYPVTVTPDETGGFVAEIEDLPGCFTQGETIGETFANIEEARRLWLEVAYEDDTDIPLPNEGQSFSGNIPIRAPRSLHRSLSIMAKREGVSLNQYLVSVLSRAIGYVDACQDSSKSRSGKE